MDGTRHSDRPADNASGATRHESAAIGDKQGGDEGSAKELRQLVAQVLQAQKELNEAIGKLTANGAVASAGGEVNVKALGKAIAAQIAQPLADAIDGSVLSNLEPLVDGVSKMNQNVANKLGAMHKHVADVKRLARESASRSVQSQAMQTKIYQSIEGREEGGEIVGGLRSDVQGVIDGLAKKLNASSLIHGMRVSNPSSDHLASVGSAGTPNVAQNAETASDGGGSGSGAASDNDDGALGEGDHSAEEDGEDGEDPDEMRCHLALDKLTGVRVADFFDDFLDKNACDPRPIAYMSKVADRRDLDCEERISFYAKYNPNMLGSLGGDIKYDAALGWRCSALMGKFMIDFVRFKCDEDEAAKFDSLVNLYGLAKKDSVLRKALDVARRTFQKAYKSSVVNKYVDAAKGNGDADKQLIHELIYVARQAFARANPGKELEKANLSDWIRETLLGGDPARIDDAWVGSDELARKLRAEGGGEPEAAAEGSAQTPQSETAAQAPAAQESAATGAAAGPPAAGSPAAPPQ